MDEKQLETQAMIVEMLIYGKNRIEFLLTNPPSGGYDYFEECLSLADLMKSDAQRITSMANDEIRYIQSCG